MSRQVLTLCFLTALCTSFASAAEKPNIILIMADDLGYGDLGCYGQETIQTPTLDRMAEEGLRFTRFYAGYTVCLPSRCALMTGLHTGHARCRVNRGGGNHPMLHEEDTTIATVLKAAGYTTGMTGKWALGDEFVGCAVVWATRIFGTLAFGKEAMGLGDVHLMGAAGAVIGPAFVVVAFFIAPFFGLAWAGLRMLSKETRQIPYGPFLSLGVLVVMIFHNRIYSLIIDPLLFTIEF